MSDPTTLAVHNIVLSETVTLAANVDSYTLINANGSVSGAGSTTVLGSCTRAGSAGEQMEVVTLGVVPVRASGGPIAVGDLLQAGANGTVTVAQAGSAVIGRARTETLLFFNQETGSQEAFVIAAIGFNVVAVPNNS